MVKTRGAEISGFDAIVVGAGFAGLYMLHKLRRLGLKVRVYETAAGVGGTWFWNRYPGARCDAQSLVYAYTFDDSIDVDWKWTERYATQPEILRYLNHIADRLELRRDIEFNSRVVSAEWDDSGNRWTVQIDGGAAVSAQHLIMASGALSAGRLPDICGVRSFAGAQFHTADWPQEGVDFNGKRVAVIGTGSSGVQAIPLIAAAAGELTVFQRTPAFTVPARNAPISAEEQQQFSEQRAEFRRRLSRGEVVGIGDVILGDKLPATQPAAVALSPEERTRIYEARWAVGGALIARSFADTLTNEDANRAMAEFFRAKIRDIVKDPEVAGMLSPTDYPIGSKRLCVGTDYYETFNRDNVTLVDLHRTPIESITPRGIRTREREHDFDIIVFATGFDAMTGALARIDIRGVSGVTLQQTWAEGPKSYLGIGVAGFPNLFTVTGPGSPSVLGNVVISIEQHVEWIADLMDYMRSRKLDRIEADDAAQEEWTAHVTAAAAQTLMMKGKSWYLGANVPGKPRVFMPYIKGIAVYRDHCDAVARDGYRGFHLTTPSTTAEAPTAALAAAN
jgi:cation diffusion facilitator CzcD-associated flavoprotein CzcO